MKKYCDNYLCDNEVQYIITDILGKKHKVCKRHQKDYGKIVKKDTIKVNKNDT